MSLISNTSVVLRPFPVITLSFFTLLILFMSVDVFFVLADLFAFVAEKVAMIPKIPDYIKITRDRALPEIYGYIEWAVIVVSLLWLAVRERWLAPVRWAAVFVMILVDDSFQVHETIGLYLTGMMTLPDSLKDRSQDIAELLVFGVMGLIAIALTASMFFSRDDHTRAISKRFGIVILFLVFFGVLLDFLHQSIVNLSAGSFVAQVLPQIFAIIEDGGEMFVASYAAAYVLTLPGLERSRDVAKPTQG